MRLLGVDLGGRQIRKALAQQYFNGAQLSHGEAYFTEGALVKPIDKLTGETRHTEKLLGPLFAVYPGRRGLGSPSLWYATHGDIKSFCALLPPPADSGRQGAHEMESSASTAVSSL
jgi:hypothetical protein